MDNKASVTAIRIDDLDRPIYRIFPLWFFDEALRLQQLAFVSPRAWPDPREDICARITMIDQGKPGWPQKQLIEFLPPVLAQCWTYEDDSDVLLRAYSRVRIDPIAKRNSEPIMEGVRVKATPRRLIEALELAADRTKDCKFFVGSVEYGDPSANSQLVVNMLAKLGPKQIGEPENRAQSLLLKSKIFRHEHEVRAIAVSNGSHGPNDIIRVPFERNELFEEVQFDPRLISFERMEREEWAKKLGYSGAFGTNYYYIRTEFLVPVPNGWGD